MAGKVLIIREEGPGNFRTGDQVKVAFIYDDLQVKDSRNAQQILTSLALWNSDVPEDAEYDYITQAERDGFDDGTHAFTVSHEIKLKDETIDEFGARMVDMLTDRRPHLTKKQSDQARNAGKTYTLGQS